MAESVPEGLSSTQTPPILGFGAALAHIDDADEVARLLMGAVTSVVSAPLRGVLLRASDDAAPKRFGRLGARPLEEALWTEIDTLTADGPVSRSHDGGQPVTSEAQPALAEHGICRLHEVRIGTVDHQFGRVVVGREEDAPYTPTQVASLQMLAAQAALALHRIQLDAERAAKARALKEREERYRHLAEAVFEGVVLTDSRTIIDLNRQFAEMLGYERSELMGRDVLEVVSPAERPTVAERIAEGFEGAYETQCVHADGTTFPVEVRGRMMEHQGRTVRVTAVRDISRQKQTEAALRAARDKLEERVKERTTELEAVNEKLRRQTKRLEILRDIDRAILAAESPQEIAEAMLRRIDQLIPCARASVALFDWERNQGEVLAMYREGASELGKGVTLPLNAFRITDALQSGQAEVVHDVEAVRQTEVLEQIRKEGVRSYMSLPMRVEGDLIGIVNVGAETRQAYTAEYQRIAQEVADQLAISIRQSRLMERIDRQREELEERVKERTAELEAFTYSVSHDLRSPLRAVDGFSQMLREQYGDQLDDEGQRLLDVIYESTQKMGQLIDGLLTLSRIGRREMRTVPVDLEALTREVVDELQRAAPDRSVTVDVAALPTVEADRSMLRQVLVNLLSNAFKFTRNEAHPRIDVGVMERDNAAPVMYVQDNGAGFDSDYAEQLFGVFERLHEEDEFEGTGVGLAIVERIVRRHGGDVWAEGAEGEGATFYFTLDRLSSADR